MQIGCLIVVIVLGVSSFLLVIASSMIYGNLVDELNERLPESERVSANDRTKVFWASRRYAELFPDSHRSRLAWGLGVLGLLTFIAFCIVALMCFGSVVPSK